MQTSPGERSEQDTTVDVIVVGSGAGGLTAALASSMGGRKTLVIEKASMWGGTSATSGGMIWIPASPLADPQHANDSAEAGFTYLRQLTDTSVSDARVRAYIAQGRSMLDWLHAETEVRFRSLPYTDYRPDVEGAQLGYRTHDPAPLDGRLLAPEDLQTLRPSAPAALLFNRLAFTMDEVHPLLHRPPGWWRVLFKVMARYYLDIGQRLRSRRNRYLAAGNALSGRLKLSLDRRQVPLWLDTAMIEITRDAATGRVNGIVAERAGKQVRIHARRAVIVASGGFERNAGMRRRYLPGAWDPSVSGSVDSDVGDGINAGQRIGAALDNMDAAWWGPMLRFPDEDRARLLTFERALPGCIIVNQAGRRYMNEAAAYDLVGQDMLAADRPDASTSPSFMIFDNRFRRQYPVGPLMPGVPLFLHQRGLREILVQTPDLAELARRIGVPSARLVETVRRFNDDAVRGKDLEFGRGDTPYDRFYGDPKVTPNPTLGPLLEAPYFSIPVHAGDIGTSGGLLTNEHAQVLDVQGQPIAGLYATGNTSASVMGHAYPGAGGTIGPAMTFGYVAARHALGS